MLSFVTYPLGDHAITLEWPQEISPAVHGAVMQAYQALKERKLYGVRDIIPAYASLTLVYDIHQVCTHYQTTQAYSFLEQEIQFLKQLPDNGLSMPPGKYREIPVCYHPSLAWDLSSVAIAKKTSVEEIIRLHTGTVYQVYMLGFLPGFAYMGTLTEALCMPRKETARLQVPAGSVGIAGKQTGIYPSDSPGGWNIIGQTPVSLLDISKEEPSLLQPGDQVQFIPVSLDEFFHLKTAGKHAGT